ncbi:MAG TPA: heptosyltransferase [Sphingobacteriaceae bacterium]|nr:heptosyltransferase [Sphingobacteriaceae bacterium]
MGDVAMTAPVIHEFRQNYPDVPLIVVSRHLYEPFFEGISGLTFHPFYPKGEHKGLKGIWKLYKELNAYPINRVADLHDSLRSKLLRNLFSLRGIKVRSIDKGRPEKAKLTRIVNKVLVPLKRTTERYADVFRALGFPFELKNILAREAPKVSKDQNPILNYEKTQKWIGVSPFAQHAQKIYPFDKTETVVLQLAEQNYKLFIFGGTEDEKRIAESWEQKHKNVVSLVNKTDLEGELNFISRLDLMISMDSLGMHLASLKGIPVVSVWGATHPFAGFLGYGQDIKDAVQMDLGCRPCSIYGNKQCFRGDFACMNYLPENLIIDKVIEKLNYD